MQHCRFENIIDLMSLNERSISVTGRTFITLREPSERFLLGLYRVEMKELSPGFFARFKLRVALYGSRTRA